MASTEIEEVMRNPPTNKNPGPDGFTGEFCQTLQEELVPVLLKLFRKIEEEGTLSNSFYEASVTLIPKPDKDHKKRDLQANIPVNTEAKILNRIFCFFLEVGQQFFVIQGRCSW